jgi:hypothetical protein
MGSSVEVPFFWRCQMMTIMLTSGLGINRIHYQHPQEAPPAVYELSEVSEVLTFQKSGHTLAAARAS